MNDLETMWLASIALLSSLLIYPLVRKGSLFYWFSVLSILLLFAMAVETRTVEARTAPQPTHVQPSFAGIDPVNAKALEFVWFITQEQKKANGKKSR